MSAAAQWPGSRGDIAPRDPTRQKARYLLAREALPAELYGRRCERAIGTGDFERSEHVTRINVPRAAGDLDRQIDVLLDRIRALVFERGVLEADGAGDIELRANRQAIQRSRERLALLVKYQQGRTAPPAA